MYRLFGPEQLQFQPFILKGSIFQFRKSRFFVRIKLSCFIFTFQYFSVIKQAILFKNVANANHYFVKVYLLNNSRRVIKIFKGINRSRWDVQQCFVRQLFGFCSTIEE